MKKLLLSALLFGTANLAFALPRAEAPTTDGDALSHLQEGKSGTIQQILQPYVDRKEIAGAVSMLSVSGRVDTVYIGLAHPDKGTKYAPDTFFWIASMSKGFCGAAVMACVDQGLVALDDPIAKFLPAFKDIRVKEKTADGTVTRRPPKVAPTLRMCLSHVAGFSGMTDNMASCRSLADIAADAVASGLVRDPLVQHQYSNVDIDIAARVVEVVTGLNYADFLEKTFFKPLKMEEITFFPTDEQLARTTFVARVAKDKPYADGTNDHWAQWLKPSFKHRFVEAGGGLFARAGDVMKFYQMLANDGCAPDGTRLLSHASILELARAQYPDKDRYSLGLRQYGDWFGHDGALQTEAYANWKENRVALLFVQVTGDWDLPFKQDWRNATIRGKKP